MRKKNEIKGVRNIAVKMHVSRLADADDPFRYIRSQLEVLVDGKKLDLPPLSSFCLSMDAKSRLPLVTLSFLAPELQLQLEGPTQVDAQEEPSTPAAVSEASS